MTSLMRLRNLNALCTPSAIRLLDLNALCTTSMAFRESECSLLDVYHMFLNLDALSMMSAAHLPNVGALYAISLVHPLNLDVLCTSSVTPLLNLDAAE